MWTMSTHLISSGTTWIAFGFTGRVFGSGATRARWSSGFSLLELCVVLACLAVGTLAVFPQWQQRGDRLMLKAAVAAVDGLIQQAQLRALTQHWDVTLVSRSSAQGWQLAICDSQSTQRQVKCPAQASLAAPHLRLSQTDYPKVDVSLHYAGDGLRIGHHQGRLSNGHFRLSLAGDTSKTIKIITAYGANRIRVCALGAGFYGYPAC